MKIFLKELPLPLSKEKEKREGKKKSSRFSENLSTLPELFIYQPRPSRIRSESFLESRRKAYSGRKNASSFIEKNDENTDVCAQEASGFVTRQEEFVVGDEGNKKENLVCRGTRSLPILTTVVVLCKLECRIATTMIIRIFKESSRIDEKSSDSE